MNISLNKNDYSSLEQFRDVLEDALSKKARTLRKRIALSLDTEKSYKDSLYHYLYWKLLDEFEDSYSSLETHEITITETGGTGGYYLNDGYFRKAGNDVTLEVIPPEGLVVKMVTANNNRISHRIENKFVFTMPDLDTLINITYSGTDTLMIIYYGSSDQNIIYNPENGAQVTYVEESITIPFNSELPEYIWFASPVQMTTVEAHGYRANIEDTFTESLISIRGVPYYLYTHKWKTEVDNLTFYN